MRRETLKKKVMKPAFWAAVAALLLAGACKGRARPPASANPGPRPQSQLSQPEPPRSAEGSRRSEGADLAGLDDLDDIRSKSLEALNADSPLVDVHFEFDSAELTSRARQILDGHAGWLKTYRSIQILVEGHCDERGTVEYNLALGDRRSQAAYNYLASLGITGDRMRTISYGKEFPLDPGHHEGAWSKNRRARFVITAK
jgi:peptidoglycan-associated lipoprotein